MCPTGPPPRTHARIENTRYPEGSQIQIQFTGADYWDDTAAADLVYSWRLDGKDWSAYVGASSVTLSDVPAGNHRMEVRARDRDGNVDPNPVVVGFEIVPPLWKQTWFILLVLAVTGLVVFLLYTLYRIRLKAALALDEFKLDFFTNISHELLNPLAVIISPIEMLLDAESDKGTRKKLHIALRNARKMQSMIGQLLQFRKIEKGRWTLNFEGGEIIGFTRETVMNHEPLWQAKNQQLEIQLPSDAFLCNFDADVLQKVIDNLVSNAIKYSAEDTVIRMKAEIQHLDEHDHYLLAIEDEGIGIPLHEQKNVLQPFYRVNHESFQEGTGVGLATVNQLVSLWGGEIAITSPLKEHGTGTRFTVRLPLEPYEDPDKPDPSAALEPLPKPMRPTLLLVEDNEDMLHILADAFSGDYQIEEAGEGGRGFELARKLNPDLIVSDVMMPGMNGFEFCEKLKEDPETSHIPVILLTAKGSVEHRIEGIKAGADAYIAKPLDVQHLRARIENLLQSRKELQHKFARQLVIEATEITVTPTDELILSKAIKIVEDNMRDEDFDVERFGQLMGMSRSTLKRKLKAATGQSPQPFIQKLRLKRAAQLLRSGQMSVSDVAAMVGFYDTSYFGKVFKREFGKAPSQFCRGRSEVKS